MRKLLFGINLTLDGCCDHTKGIPNEEVHEYFTQLTLDAGELLYGRKTYELMVPFWPDIAKNNSSSNKAMNDFAQAFNAVNRITLVSQSLQAVESKNTHIINNNLKDEVLKLKQQEGKNILTGGVDVPSQLLQLGLIDEFHIVIHPIIVGEGRRLFDNISLTDYPELNLVDSTVFKSGHVALRYLKN
ncbi:MAG: dihydrofolate reductase family protein [Sphingobacteriales bacterium JAD_PAG50586_3]|nr:MAG: dihydrofolate reductase family protein [Sphingobacteriales bacterium JAD_PAG50586_3]